MESWGEGHWKGGSVSPETRCGGKRRTGRSEGDTIDCGADCGTTIYRRENLATSKTRRRCRVDGRRRPHPLTSVRLESMSDNEKAVYICCLSKVRFFVDRRTSPLTTRRRLLDSPRSRSPETRCVYRKHGVRTSPEQSPTDPPASLPISPEIRCVRVTPEVCPCLAPKAPICLREGTPSEVGFTGTPVRFTSRLIWTFPSPLRQLVPPSLHSGVSRETRCTDPRGRPRTFRGISPETRCASQCSPIVPPIVPVTPVTTSRLSHSLPLGPPPPRLPDTAATRPRSRKPFPGRGRDERR